ncbi:unnamed protein product [Lymnaea stagnalis]|uniref:Neuroblastoma-amplified sequence n=1 Tax=Lymnaea stagnalis TaxID=6523 RepID=A0AAV2HTZ3_LYMST
MADVEGKSSENILYDLSVLSEWRYDNELFIRNSREKTNASLIGRTSSLVRRTSWTFLRSVGIAVQMPTPCILPEQLVKLRSSQIAWKIAVSSLGNFVAILQENGIEIRTQRDNLESVFGRNSCFQDPCPQWRCVVWSEDETILACSQSNGAVDFFDILGSLLFTIPGVFDDGVTPTDLSDGVAALIFTDFKQDNDWTYELLVINYHGSMSSYLVHQDNGYKLRYKFTFTTEYPRGISSATYNSKHKILFVGGACLPDSLLSSSKASLEGISAWRLLSDAPYCKLITDYHEDKQKLHFIILTLICLHENPIKQMLAWLLLRCFCLFKWATYGNKFLPQDGIFHLCLSPCATMLVSIHFSGKLSLWDVPSLRLRHQFKQYDQPGWDEISPELLENPTKKKKIKDLIPHKQLLDVNFWSDDLLILARCTGAVSVVSCEDLHNLLGASPEWYEPSPQLTPALNGGFLGLECEIRFPNKRIVMTGPDDDDSEEEAPSIMAQTTAISKQVLYYLTDSEHFQPPKKKPRYVTKVYRVVSLKSTTPEELYARKIEAEEYGEALTLAQAYKLDCDLVYQRQWRKSPVTRASIEDYLAKISKRSWVLHECLERVPENIDAMRELMEYGLQGTDLQALVAVGKGEDAGRFLLCDPDEGLYEDVYDVFDPNSLAEKERKRAQIRQSYLDQVDFKNLNLEQKEICRSRLKFLVYLDRLKTYELILGGMSAAVERYNAEFFASFRTRNIFELTTEYAQNNDWKAVDIILVYHNNELAPHRLAILSNFPETADPVEYKSLLPKSGDDDEIVPWETATWRDQDWAEVAQCRKAVDLGDEDGAAFLYINFNSKYRTEQLSFKLVEEWYHERACEIEQKSRIVDNAIELVKLGIERGFDNLHELLDDLVTMAMMVYECGVAPSLEFSQLREMADYDRLELIMAKSTEEMYTKNLRRWLVPFLQRCDQKEPGAYDQLLKDFVVTQAQKDLTLVLKLFETSKPSVASPVIKTQTELMSLALDALYSCRRHVFLQLAHKIFECLPLPSTQSRKESSESLRLHQQVDQLERHLRAASILEAYGMKKTLAYIKSTENDQEEVRSLMIKLTRQATKRSIPLTDMEWHKLHDDIMSLQAQIYTCIPANICREIYVESLMCSGRQETIRLAGQLLERSSSEPQPSRASKGNNVEKVPYPRAVELALSAAREYFDSSANLSDSCMDLARSCLNLILDSPKPVQEELDLIASLALLDEFGVSVLPLQVRLSKDRLEFVKLAVSTKPTSYKQTQRLIRLGQLLGIPCDNSQPLEGQILHMAAEASISALDYEFAYQCCDRLISLCYSPSWSVCVKLAEQESFRNIDAKAKLLSFAVTYCVKEKIQPVLQARCLLKTQILYEQVNKVVGEETSKKNSDSRESPFSARAVIQQTQQILSSSKQTVLSTFTDAKWWQSAFSSLQQSSSKQKTESKLQTQDNADMKKQGCHPFYASIIEGCYEDWKSFDLEGGHKKRESDLSANILRTAMLEEMLTRGSTQHPVSEALVDLAKLTMPRDASLGLAYLIATPKDYDVSSCFEEFPITDISLQLAVYYYALQIYSTMQPSTPPHVYVLYRQIPSRIVARVIDYIASFPESKWPAEVNSLVKKLKSYHEMLEDYNQACTLKRLGRGVDVMRFAEDPEYKRETIFGLAMSLEDEVYNIALSLAQRYDLDLWEVYMCHLEFLFSDSGLSMEELQTRVSKLDIVTTLKERNSDFTERMMTRVYPTLAGADMRGLAYFFSLLEGVQEKVLCGLSASEHSALLKKLKSACPSLDYKKLMDNVTAPVDVLQPCLTANNIHTLAKLAPQIPNKENGFLHPSCLYSYWATQVFLVGDGKKKWPPEIMSGWIHHYESLFELIQKLRPEDLLNFIDSIVFTPSSRKLMDVPCRQEITKRALKFSRQSNSGKKKKQEDSVKSSWDDCCNQLELRLTHLKSLTNDTIQSFAQATDSTFFSYAERYDLSKGDLQQLEVLLVQMILDGQAVELVDDILQVAPPTSLKTRTIVRQAVTLIVKSLRGEDVKKEVTVTKSWLEVLELVVENVREHQDNGGDLVQAEDVISLLRAFCSDSSIEVQHRLDVLRVLEKSFDLSECDKTLLTLYRTQALVSSAWPQTEISEANIMSEESRLVLVSQLLDQSTSKEHFITLGRLLNVWPTLSATNSSNPETNLWVQLFKAVVASQGQDGGNIINNLLEKECSVFPLDEKCTEEIYDMLCEHDQPIFSVKLALRCPHQKLIEKSLTLLANLTQGIEDEDLFQLILHKKLAPQIVSMPVFSPLINYLLEVQDPADLVSTAMVASQLSEAGFTVEAGSLMLQAQSSHSLLLTFNSALISTARKSK